MARWGPLPGAGFLSILSLMKTGFALLPKWGVTLPAALAVGLALVLPGLRAGTEAVSPDSGAKTCLTDGSQTKAERKAKARAEKKTRAKKAKAAEVAPREITGSHLKQRVVLRRFPETTAPVEIFDREQIERRGEATLGGFLSRQSIFR